PDARDRRGSGHDRARRGRVRASAAAYRRQLDDPALRGLHHLDRRRALRVAAHLTDAARRAGPRRNGLRRGATIARGETNHGAHRGPRMLVPFLEAQGLRELFTLPGGHLDAIYALSI